MDEAVALGGEEDGYCVEKTEEGEGGYVADEFLVVVFWAEEGVEG